MLDRNSKEYKQLSKLLKDTYNKSTAVNFSVEEGNDVVRKLFTEAVGGKWDENSYRRHKTAVFEVIELVTEMVTGEYLTNQFDGLAHVTSVPLLSKPAYTYQDPTLFRVSRIAAGTNDLRRQRLLNDRFEIVTEWFGVSVYTEFDQFIAGQIDFTEWLNRVARSVANYIGVKIYETIHSSYQFINAAFRARGQYDEDTLVEIVRHLRAASGQDVVIYGTEGALRRITRGVDLQWTSEVIINTFHSQGFVTSVAGLNLALLPQVHKPITSSHGVPEFQIDENMLLILPAGQRIVHLVHEGQTRVQEVNDSQTRNDQQIEFTFKQKMGVAVAQMAVFGMYMLED